jgi:hypothetical protein
MGHAGKKVFSTKTSIQGKWRENMWDSYPRHEMEKFEWISPPQFETKEVKIYRPTEEEKRRPDMAKKLLKRKSYYIQSQPESM